MRERPHIRVYCPNCAVVRLRPREVTLRICLDNDQWEYRFTCPTCGRRAVEPSDRWLALEAFAAGAGLERWKLPAELDEPHRGPPISVLDLYQFHRLLSGPDWFADLERTEG